MVTFIARVSSLGYFLLFLGAALSKFDTWRMWAETTRDLFSGGNPFSRGKHLTKLVRVAVPLVEMMICATLLIAPARGLLLSSVLLAVFAGGVYVLSKNHAGSKCNCLGALASSTISPLLALRNLLLALVAAIGAQLADRSRMLSITPPEVALTLLVGLIILLYGEGQRLRKAREIFRG